MENVNWENYDNESLEFILKESEKKITETITSYRQITNKNYLALAFFVSVLSFCLNEIVKEGINCSDIPYFVTLSGVIICIFIIWTSLLPAKIVLIGVKPELLLRERFENLKTEERLRKYKIGIIEGYNDGIEKNHAVNAKRIQQFKSCISTLLYTFVIAIISYFLFV